MDAGSFVIALLTAAGAAAGPAPGAPGGIPDAASPAGRCIAAPDEDNGTGDGSRDSGALDLPERSDSSRADAGADAEALAERRADAEAGQDARPDTGQGTGLDTGQGTGLDTGQGTGLDTGLDSGFDTGQDTRSGTSALAEELALELAEVVAGSDDPTARRLAAALAAAGFEAEPGSDAAVGSREQQETASRSDDRSGRLGDDRLDQDKLDENQNDQLGDDQNDRLGDGQNDQRPDALDCDPRSPEQDLDADGAGASGPNLSSDLADVLSSTGSEERSRASVESAADRGRSADAADRGGSSAPGERSGSDIAAALERGERAAG